MLEIKILDGLIELKVIIMVSIKYFKTNIMDLEEKTNLFYHLYLLIKVSRVQTCQEIIILSLAKK